MAEIHTLVVGQLQTNCYLITSRGEAIIVDPGDEPERILKFIKDIHTSPTRIVATHTHFDHVLGVDRPADTTSPTQHARKHAPAPPTPDRHPRCSARCWGVRWSPRKGLNPWNPTVPSPTPGSTRTLRQNANM